jgi:ABC-2 type transport system ATP-binding protein
MQIGFGNKGGRRYFQNVGLMMIRIENLCKTYKDVQALKGVTLQVEQGELFAYLGPNGAGKTTTIRILTGLTKLSSGNAWINGCHIERDSLKTLRQCGVVPQSINLDQELTVFENLDIHGRLFHMPRKEREVRIGEMLEYVGLDGRKNSFVKHLSGGMRRRLMIARALVHAPRILFLDEPTVGLDAGIRRKIWALIKKIQQNGTTIFLTTHYIEEAEFLADRVAFLDEGRIVTVDTPQRLMENLGAWAIDCIDSGEMKTIYLRSREEAGQYTEKDAERLTLRRVNLEDAFLSLTGKKVQ